MLFLRFFKSDSTDWPDEIFQVLDGIFGDVDSYCGDERLREATGDIGAAELRSLAGDSLSLLARLAG